MQHVATNQACLAVLVLVLVVTVNVAECKSEFPIIELYVQEVSHGPRVAFKLRIKKETINYRTNRFNRKGTFINFRLLCFTNAFHSFRKDIIEVSF